MTLILCESTTSIICKVKIPTRRSLVQSQWLLWGQQTVQLSGVSVNRVFLPLHLAVLNGQILFETSDFRGDREFSYSTLSLSVCVGCGVVIYQDVCVSLNTLKYGIQVLGGFL